jgi:hypothetical protein
LVAKRQPLPHGIGTDPERSDLERLVDGDHETSEGPYITAPHKAGDIFTHAYNGGGGFGDVLQRDPVKTASDVENGFMTRQAAEQVYGIVLTENRDGALEADLRATADRRERMRRQRLERARPVSAWLDQERRRVMASDFAPEVRKMYRSAMRLSDRFAAEFRSFWGLASDHEVAEGGVR